MHCCIRMTTRATAEERCISKFPPVDQPFAPVWQGQWGAAFFHLIPAISVRDSIGLHSFLLQLSHSASGVCCSKVLPGDSNRRWSSSFSFFMVVVFYTVEAEAESVKTGLFLLEDLGRFLCASGHVFNSRSICNLVLCAFLCIGLLLNIYC